MPEDDSYYERAYGEWRVFCAGMPAFDIEPRRTALVIMDMQHLFASPTGVLGRRMREEGLDELYVDYFGRVREVQAHISELRAAAERSGVDVIYATIQSHDAHARDISPALRHRGLWAAASSPEWQIVGELAPRPRQVVLDRPCLSLFTTPTAAATFRNMGIDTLLLVGLLTNISIESTARDGTDSGFKIAVVDEACTALTTEDHRQGLETLGMCFAVINTKGEVLAQFEQQRANSAVWR